jgi:hypothetical protein
MTDAPHDARYLASLDEELLVKTLTHLRQLQALALDREDLRRAHELGRIAKDYQVALDRRVAGDGPRP